MVIFFKLRSRFFLVNAIFYCLFTTFYLTQSSVIPLTDQAIRSLVSGPEQINYEVIPFEVKQKIGYALEKAVINGRFDQPITADMLWKKINHHLEKVNVDEKFIRTYVLAQNGLLYYIFALHKTTIISLFHDMSKWNEHNRKTFFKAAHHFIEHPLDEQYHYYFDRSFTRGKTKVELKQLAISGYAHITLTYHKKNILKRNHSITYSYPFVPNGSSENYFRNISYEGLIYAVLMRIAEIDGMNTCAILYKKERKRQIASLGDAFYKNRFDNGALFFDKIKENLIHLDLPEQKLFEQWIIQDEFFVRHFQNPNKLHVTIKFKK